jgi:hypothetical protein
MMPEFDKRWKEMGLDDDDLRELQDVLLVNPEAGPVMKGTGGLRKLRIAFQNKGKSGSGRVAYVDFAFYETLYLITAYPKNEKDNLTKVERNAIAKVIMTLKQNLRNEESAK